MKLAKLMTLGHVDWKWINFDMEKSFHMGEMDDNNMVVSMKLNKHYETRCSSEIEYMVEVMA
jgi:hypothetical protein